MMRRRAQWTRSPQLKNVPRATSSARQSQAFQRLLLGSFGSHGRQSECPRTSGWNLRTQVDDAMQVSMRDKRYMFKKGGHVRHHLTVAGVISLLSVLCVSSAESRALTTTPVLTDQEALSIAKTPNRQTKKTSLDI